MGVPENVVVNYRYDKIPKNLDYDKNSLVPKI